MSQHTRIVVIEQLRICAQLALVAVAAVMLTACGTQRRQCRRRQRPAAGSGRAGFCDRLHEGAAVRRAHERADADRRARHPALQRRHRPLRSRSRVADGAGAQRHDERDAGPRRRHGRRDLDRRQESAVRHARPVRSEQEHGRAADVEDLGVHVRDRYAASHHRVRHHGGGRPGHLAALPAGWPHPVRLDSPTSGQGGPARRRQAAVRRPRRESAEPRVRAARHA